MNFALFDIPRVKSSKCQADTDLQHRLGCLLIKNQART